MIDWILAASALVAATGGFDAEVGGNPLLVPPATQPTGDRFVAADAIEESRWAAHWQAIATSPFATDRIFASEMGHISQIDGQTVPRDVDEANARLAVFVVMSVLEDAREALHARQQSSAAAPHRPTAPTSMHIDAPADSPLRPRSRSSTPHGRQERTSRQRCSSASRRSIRSSSSRGRW
jgi:hypothetical protein